MGHVIGKQGFGERFSQERPLDGPHLTFDLAAENERLLSETPWADHGHNAITLAKYPDLCVVLTALKAGVRMSTRGPRERITVQVLSGRLRVRSRRTSFDVARGQVVATDRAVVHELEALEDTSFLLTVSGAAQEHVEVGPAAQGPALRG